MKFALAQIGKIRMPYSYDEELDLSQDLDGFEDIISSEKCICHTVVDELDFETYQFKFDIKIKLIISDSVSLEEKPYEINALATEIYTTNKDYEDATIIDTLTIDTKEAILEAILEEKPYSQTSYDFKEYYKDEINDEDTEEVENNSFAKLKDLL